MLILDHAIRRYKLRVGKRTASKRRIIKQINRDVKHDVVERKKSHVKGHFIIVTSKYQAVCYKHIVFTIKYLDDDARNIAYKQQLEELYSGGL